MSTNDDRKNAPKDDDRALGTGADGDLENPAAGLDEPTVVKPIGSEPVDGVGVAGDTPEPVAAPAVSEPTAPAPEEEK